MPEHEAVGEKTVEACKPFIAVLSSTSDRPSKAPPFFAPGSLHRQRCRRGLTRECLQVVHVVLSSFS